MKNIILIAVVVGVAAFGGVILLLKKDKPAPARHVADKDDDDSPAEHGPAPLRYDEQLPAGGQAFPVNEQKRLAAIAALAAKTAREKERQERERGPVNAGAQQPAVAVEKVPPKIEIISPPEDSTDPSDKTARMAAHSYKLVVKAMQLAPEQEEKFLDVLYDSKQNYSQAMKVAEEARVAARAKAANEDLDPKTRAEAAAQANSLSKAAWDDQRALADQIMKEVLSDDQFRIYSTLVQNPLFMSNGLKFQYNAPPAPPQ